VIRRLSALFYVLTLVFPFSAIPSAGFANAQDPELCTVTTVSEGALSSAAPGQTKHLSSLGVDSGMSAEVDFNCSSPVKLAVAASQIEGDALDPSFLKVIATNRTNGVSTKSGESPLDLGVGTTRVSIDLVVDKPSTFVPGKYKFIVHMSFS
jgi:hypothetical protein